MFELTLAPASQVVKGSDTSKLVYKLTDIQLEYETIRSKQLADEATTFYTYGKEFEFEFYDQIVLEEVIEVHKGTNSGLKIKVNSQRRSRKGILLLFIEPYHSRCQAL